MILIAAVGTSGNQRDWVRLRCHGQSCLYYQWIEELFSSLRHREKVRCISKALRGCYRSARPGEPVITELTLAFLLSLSFVFSLVRSS